MGDYNNPCVTGFLQHWLQHSRIIRHNADDIHALRNQIFNSANLQRWISTRWPDHNGIIAQFRRSGFDTGFHGVEPGNATDFDDDADLNILGNRGD